MVLIDRDRASRNLRAMAQALYDTNHPGKAALFEAAARRVEAIPPEGWTELSREKPPEDKKVLGWRDGAYGICRIFDHDFDGEPLWQTTFWRSLPPTHWMELPDGPQGES